MAKQLDVGDNAPDFTLPRDGGGEITLSDFHGKKVVLYFYPKDSTPGCTNEAKDFTHYKQAIEKSGGVVIGVSRDSVKRHDNFIEKYDLDVILASDEDGEICERYGVWKEKKMYGKSFMGIERSTFLIDDNGKIEKIWRKVKVKDHAKEVLDALS